MLTLTDITWLDIGLAGVGVYLVKQVFTQKNPAPYPPGPPGRPLVGNIPDMPQVKPWLTFTEWGKKYGGCLLFCHKKTCILTTPFRRHLACRGSGSARHSPELCQGCGGNAGKEELCLL